MRYHYLYFFLLNPLMMIAIFSFFSEFSQYKSTNVADFQMEKVTYGTVDIDDRS